jgi:hypothetical protein
MDIGEAGLRTRANVRFRPLADLGTTDPLRYHRTAAQREFEHD